MTDTHALHHRDYPRSNAYDPKWIMDNQMGPNVLWLTEALTQVLDLRPGMKVLDLGCGRALSSILLAREFGVSVWAADLWIDAASNRQRIRDAGVGELVTAVDVEAHALPFKAGFFDICVSIDSYHYYGTDDLYVGTITRFLKPGGRLGIVVPGVTEEFGEIPPPGLEPYWAWDFCSFHSPRWWRRHWEKTGLVTVERADMIPDGRNLWLRWLQACRDAGYPAPRSEEIVVRSDRGSVLGFTRVVGIKPDGLTE